MNLHTLLDIPAYFDPINRVEGAISTFLNADWRGTFQRRGWWGVAVEFFACVFSTNSPTIYISRYSHWRGIDVERLLKRHGVKLWDRGLAGDNLYFCVKRRQVKFAEYIMLRAGVPVTSRLVEPRNRQYAERFSPPNELPSRSAASGRSVSRKPVRRKHRRH